jgi:hypothetical protein
VTILVDLDRGEVVEERWATALLTTVLAVLLLWWRRHQRRGGQHG